MEHDANYVAQPRKMELNYMLTILPRGQMVEKLFSKISKSFVKNAMLEKAILTHIHSKIQE